MRLLKQTRNNYLTVYLLLLLSLFSFVELKSQPPLLRNFDYIQSYSLAAIDQMMDYGIPASVTLAQAILESRSGTSNLAQRSNNHFGIKCHLEWGGDTIIQADDTLGECFRSYENTADSYTDHSLFLLSRPRYATLFQLGVNDYKGWCQGLKNASYATFPEYAEVLITLIDNLNLHELDGPLLLLPKQFERAEKREALKPSTLAFLTPGLYQLAENNILFIDEHDVHLRSLVHAISSK